MRMPPPTDRPRRQPRRTQRGRVGLVALVAVLFVVLTSLRGIAVFYTDYLWFQELRLTAVWRGVLGAKAMLALAFTTLFFVVMWVNLLIADRLAPRFRAVGPEDELVQRYRQTVGQHTSKVRAGLAFVFALLAGTGASGQWHNWLLFRHGVDFGTKDPQFHRDVGFFVFKLPFIAFLIDWAFVAVVIVLAVSMGAHYLNGGIRLQAPAGQRVTPQVKAHLSVLLGALALIKAVGYWFQKFELDFSTRGAVHGATYTDIHAQLPALRLLWLIMIAAFILFVANIWLKGWVLPVIGIGLWMLISVTVGGIYPAVVQKFRVEPAENRFERPYISRNIASTRRVFGLSSVQTKEFPYEENLSVADLQSNAETVRNIRLWDPKQVKSTYQRLQEIRAYYQFNDIDIDRYKLEGRNTQTLVSVRELNADELPSKSWVNRHLQYTHGFGAVVAPANAVTNDGQPQFVVKNVPPIGSPKISEARIYYGEENTGYAIVRTKQPEIDFVQANGKDQTTTYAGNGGVRLSSIVRRAAMALRFSDVNFVISGQITGESRAIYLRNIHDRVRAAAPFLRYDDDPYPVIHDGRILWVQDAYTTTSRYPYSQAADVEGVPGIGGLAGSSGLASQFNYVRNSVKVVIDSYHGSMTFYLMDDKDPIAKTYAKAFPEMFTPGSTMDADLRAHLRYPEDLFRVQTNMYGRYHIDDPLAFYNAGDAWNVSQDPNSGPIGDVASPASPATGGTAAPNPLVRSNRAARMDSTYLLLRLPGEAHESFLILRPFVPRSDTDKSQNLASFMVAKSDPDEYGRLQVFVMPRGQLIDGPALVDSRIQAEPSISRDISLLSNRGSEVLLGNVLVLPIEQSLLYVRPLYVSSDRNKLPELKKVIVVYSRRAVMRDTLQEALTDLFGDAPPTLEAAGGEGGSGAPAVEQTIAQLLADAQKAFADADAALKAGDLALYQQKVKAGIALVQRARAKADKQSGGTPATTTTTRPASA